MDEQEINGLINDAMVAALALKDAEIATLKACLLQREESLCAAKRELDLSLTAASDARKQGREEAAMLCECIGTDWLDADDANKNFAADYLAKAIRALP